MAQMFNQGKKSLWEGDVALDTDDIKYAFMATSYTFDADAHEYWDDVSASLASGSAVASLASKTLTRVDASDITKFDAADISLAGQTFTSDAIIIYKDTGTPSTSVLLAYIDVTERAPVADSVTVTWNSSGIFSY